MKQKKLGYWSIVLLTINSIIGIGIFLSPGVVVKMVGSIAPYIYVCAAIFTMFLAVTFASAAKYVNKSGAGYAYAKAAFGDNIGFYIGITRVVCASIAWGVLAVAVVKSIYKIFGISSNFNNVTLGFLILMIILLIINIFGLKLLTLISNLSTIGKLLALAITIISGVIILFKTGDINIYTIDNLKNANGEFFIKPLTTTGFVTAIIAAFYAFTGFESIASGSQDMEQPEKKLPRAIPIGIVIIAIIYLGIIIVTMFINPINMALTKDPVALASVFNNVIIKKLIIVGAIVSMFGINVAASFHTPRIFEAMAHEKQIPEIFNKRTKSGVPLASFILTGLVAIIIPMTFKYSMSDIIVISSISRFVQFLVVPVALIYFYYGKAKETILEANKNFITDVIFPIISLLLTLLLLYYFNWSGKFSVVINGVRHINIYAVVAMIVGYIVIPYILYVYKEKRLK